MQNLLHSYIGDYLLTDFLGAGGMGEVYLAVHRKIDRVAAIKVLTCFNTQAKDNQRFLNEARIQAGLHHPNIVTLYDFIEFEGRPCIIMEYVDGRTLYEHIQSRGPLPINEAVTLFLAIVQAIAYVHQRGILHRDIKSNNIKINSSGQVKLLDFGIAKDTVTPNLTLAGHYVGSLYYLSPEQLMGKKVDRQSDIWSLGILLCEMVTGRLPFESRSVNEFFMKIKDSDPMALSAIRPDLHKGIRKIISLCLKQDPSQRFSCAEDLIKEIRTVFKEPITPKSEKPGKGFFANYPVFFLNFKGKLLLTAGLVLAVVMVSGVVLLKKAMEKDVAPPAMVVEKHDTGLAPPESAANNLTRVTVDTFDGRAEVYEEDQHIGQTPYIKYYPAGSKIKIHLKRKGYQDKVVQFEVGEINSQYSYSLNKINP